MKKITGVAAGALATACLFGAPAIAQLGQSAEDMPPPSVIVVEARMSDVSPSFDFVGRAEAVEQVELRARVEGFLEERNFQEGLLVEQGQPLFTIERAPYEIVLQQRQADLAGARATAQNARADFERRSALVARGNTSQAAVDDSRAALGTAEAAVQQAEAALARAELDLTYTEILAPISGLVTAARYSVGNLVGPTSDPLATVYSLDPIHITIEVSNRLVAANRDQRPDVDNPPVTPSLVMENGDLYPHDGMFDYLSPAVNPNTDTVTARAVFPNPDRLLVPGQLVTVTVRDKNVLSAIRVPQAAVQEDRDGYFVLVVDDDNIVEMRRVVVDLQIGNDWALAEGLEEGERIILRGLQKARVGEVVAPVTEEG